MQWRIALNFTFIISLVGISHGFTSPLGTTRKSIPSSFILTQPASTRSRRRAPFRAFRPVVPLWLASPNHDSVVTNRERAVAVWHRVTDTMNAAGFTTGDDDDDDGRPLLADGGTTLVKVMVVMLIVRAIRAQFFLKQSIFKRQPNWNHVITSKEQEKVLNAWTCKKCGVTMFIAKGREIRFFNQFVECYNCDAKGKDSFYDRRAEIVANEETEFDYMDRNDFITLGEKRRNRKQQKKEAAATATTTAVLEKTDTDQVVETVVVEEEEEAAPISDKVETPTMEQSTESKSSGSDLDILGMDL